MSGEQTMRKLSSLTIQARIISAFAICLVVVAALVTFSYVELSGLRTLQDEGAARAVDAINVQELAGMAHDLYAVVADAELNLDLASSESDWRTVKSESVGDLARLDKAVDTPAEQEKAREVRAAFDQIVSLFESQMLPKLKAAKASTPETLELDAQIDKQVGAMRIASLAIVESITKKSKAGDEAFDATAAQTVLWSLVMSIVGMASLIVVVAYVLRDISHALRGMAAELRTGAQQVVAASGQVAGASQGLSQGATEQAASLEETSASMEEMASMTRKNAENSQEAASQMAQSERLVGQANASLQDLVASMTAIRESSGKVTKIVKTIDEIAFQTNILALNAAVEAARAGEAGMGFAVVADEVRNLAQRSAQAAKDTAALIEESAASAQSGGVKVEAVVTSMTAITENALLVKGLIDEVSVASRQQAQGIDQVTQAISQMEKVTQTTAATAEESAAASEELNAQAEQSMSVVARLDALVGHAAASMPASGDAQARRVRTPGKVVRMTAGPSRATRQATAEAQIPLGDTGTFGSF
jgi:hypothetical protein